MCVVHSCWFDNMTTSDRSISSTAKYSPELALMEELKMMQIKGTVMSESDLAELFLVRI